MVTDNEREQLKKLVKILLMDGHIEKPGAVKLLEVIDGYKPPRANAKKH